MKEAISLLFKIVDVVVAVGCMVAAIAALIKGDPYHITMAYLAGSYVFMHLADEDFWD